MSLKDQGNDLFKKGHYQKAIERYQQYIETGGDDLKSAYSNIALCYFRLNNYQKVIQACQNALQEDKYFVKAYYRLYLTYKQMVGQDYKVYINAVMFLRYFTDEKATDKQDAIEIAKEYKKRFKDQYPLQNKLQNERIIQALQIILKNQQKQQNNQNKLIQYNTQQLQIYLLSDKIAIEEKFQAIKQVIMNNDYTVGINMTYFYQNLCKTIQNKQKIREFRKIVKIQYKQYKLKLQLQTQKQQDVQQKGQNLIESQKDNQNNQNELKKDSQDNQGNKANQDKGNQANQDDSEESFIPSSSSQDLAKNETSSQTQQKIQQIQSKDIKNDKIVEQLKQQQKKSLQKTFKNGKNYQRNQQNNLLQSKPSKHQSSNIIITPKLPTNANPSQISSLQILYNNYLQKIKISKDIFKQLRQLILQITTFNTNKQKKQQYFEKLIKRYKNQISLIKCSFSNKQKLQIYEKLISNSLDKYITIFATNVKLDQK